MDEHGESAYTFEKHLVLSIIHNKRFKDYVVGHIRPDWLKNWEFRYLYEKIITINNKNREVSFVSVSESVRRDPSLSEKKSTHVLKILNPFVEGNHRDQLESMTRGVVPIVEEEVGRNLLGDALSKSNLLYEAGETNRVFELMEKVRSQSIYTVPNRVRFWGNEDRELRQAMMKWEPGIRTGIQGKTNLVSKWLDDALFFKGVGRGQIAIVMAISSKGKSTFCFNIGAYQSLAGYNVDYYSMEVPNDYMLARINSIYTGIPTFSLTEPEGKRIADERLEIIGDLYKTKKDINLYHYAPHTLTNSMIAKNLLISASEGRKVDSVIVDYVDIMRPSRVYHDRRNEIGYNTSELRALAEEHSCCIITPTQSNRMGQAPGGKESKEVKILDMFNMSEDFSKVFTCDVLISLNFKDVKKTDIKGVLRNEEVCLIYVDKNRFGRAGQIYETPIDRKTGRFFFPFPEIPGVDLNEFEFAKVA